MTVLAFVLTVLVLLIWGGLCIDKVFMDLNLNRALVWIPFINELVLAQAILPKDKHWYGSMSLVRYLFAPTVIVAPVTYIFSFKMYKALAEHYGYGTGVALLILFCPLPIGWIMLASRTGINSWLRD